MNTLSLEPFEAYLAKRQLVPERQRPYLVRWVRLFLQGPGGDKGLSPADQKKLFQDALDKDRRLEDWQRRQAMQAVARAGIPKPASVHTLRHSFATHLLMRGVNIREVQRLLGHKSVESTMVYLHVIRNLQSIPVSPLDTLGLEGESQ